MNPLDDEFLQSLIARFDGHGVIGNTLKLV